MCQLSPLSHTAHTCALCTSLYSVWVHPPLARPGRGRGGARAPRQRHSRLARPQERGGTAQARGRAHGRAKRHTAPTPSPAAASTAAAASTRFAASPTVCSHALLKALGSRLRLHVHPRCPARHHQRGHYTRLPAVYRGTALDPLYSPLRLARPSPSRSWRERRIDERSAEELVGVRDYLLADTRGCYFTHCARSSLHAIAFKDKVQAARGQSS
jgi:hypothetical protein